VISAGWLIVAYVAGAATVLVAAYFFRGD